MRLNVFLAGRVAIEAEGVTLDETRFPGRQGRLLFAYLVAERDRPVPRDELAEALWGDAPPPTWEKALSVLVSKLRALLAECGLDGATALTGAFGCYRLGLPPSAWVDVFAAVDALDEAEEALRDADFERARTLAAEAASLGRPPFLPGEDGTWVEAKRRDLADVVRRALGCATEASLHLGDDAAAAKAAEASIALDPYLESGYRHLMQAHAAAGNRGEALRVYERCRRVLADELGAYPSPETESIYRGLLDPPAPAVAATAARPTAADVADARRARRRPAALGIAIALAVVATAAVAAAVGIDGQGSAETTLAADAVGLIDATGGRVRDEVDVGAAPTSVAFGHGAVWVTNTYANTVSRIDPKTRTVRQTISVGNSPGGIAVGGGAVWVANHDDGTVSWISPESNAVVKEIRVGNGPTAVAFGYGSVWVTNSDDRTLARIDARTGDVIRIRTGAVGRGVAAGAGAVWVTDEATKTVVQVDPATNRVANTAAVGSGPASIAYGAGAVWVGNEFDGTVSELDPQTLSVRAAIPVGGSPSALAADEDGVWVSVEFAHRVVRIDTESRRSSASLDVGNRPKGLAVVPAGVWVAVQASGEGHRGGRLVVLGDEFDSVDPALAFSTDGTALLGIAYDGLTAFRRVGGSDGTQLVADLAAALPTPTDGGTSYTFRLRDGIHYSDGTLVRPSDFRRALERAIQLGSPWLQGTSLLKVLGASRCVAGRPCDLSRGMLVEGSNSLVVRLSSPSPALLRDLSAVAPVPRGTPATPVGTTAIPSTGPYVIDSYVAKRQLTLVRNKHFRVWSERARPDGYPDEIVWRFGVPNEQAVRQVVAGKADLLLNTVPADRVEGLRARYPRRLHLVPQHATAFLFLNTRRPPFDDVRVRRAVSYALDRRRIAELHGGAAVAQPTCGTLPPTVPGYRAYCPYTADADSSGEWKAPDLSKARKLVAASGTKGQRVDLWTFPFFGAEGRYVVSVLRRLGYRARLVEVDAIKDYFTRIGSDPPVQAGFAGWFGTRVAADTFGTLGCRFRANWAHFCDPRFDRDVQRLAAQEAREPAAGAALAARLDRELVDRAPWVPLFTPRFADFTSKRVGNYQANTYASSSVLVDQLWVR